MTNEIIKSKTDLQAFVQGDKLRGEMAKVLPKHVTPERMARIAWTACVRNPALAQCERTSLATAILLCAQAGLEPDGRLAHLIPFGNKVQVIFDYKGLITLAKRNGVDAKASLIYSGDDFEYCEDDGTGHTVVRHQFNPCKPRGEIVGVYSRALANGKSPDYEVMGIEEVESIRKRSRAGDNGPWKTDYGEMAKKTVLRRHSKRWDLIPEVRDIINEDDDTPPPLAPAPARIVAPVFEEPENGKALPEAEAPQPDAPTDPQSPPSNPQPKLEAEPQNGGFNPVKAVRNLCKHSKVKENDLLGFLFEIGAASANYESLEQLHLTQNEVLQMVSDQFGDISKRILQAKEGK